MQKCVDPSFGLKSYCMFQVLMPANKLIFSFENFIPMCLLKILQNSSKFIKIVFKMHLKSYIRMTPPPSQINKYIHDMMWCSTQNSSQLLACSHSSKKVVSICYPSINFNSTIGIYKGKLYPSCSVWKDTFGSDTYLYCYTLCAQRVSYFE